MTTTPYRQAIRRSYDDDLHALRVATPVSWETLRTGSDTITTTVTTVRDFSKFDDGPPSDSELLRFQVISGGPIHVNDYEPPTAAGTEGSDQYSAGEFFEVDGPSMESIQFVLATGGANATVRVRAMKRVRE